MMELGHWEFFKEFDPSEFFGFIYRITELNTGREYIGKKQFTKMQRKVIKGRKNRKVVHSESNWKTYTGSSVELNCQILLNGIENYKFEIISLHKSKGSLYYAEVEAHVFENVLRAKLPNGDRKYFNKQIGAVKFLPPEEMLIESEMKKPRISP